MPKIPLVSLLAAMHVGIACFDLVLGGSRRCNQGGVDDRTRLEKQTVLRQQYIESGQNLLGEFFRLVCVSTAFYAIDRKIRFLSAKSR